MVVNIFSDTLTDMEKEKTLTGCSIAPTESELSRLKHALGMDNKDAKNGVFEAYRRCSLYDEPVKEWENLVEKGFAKRSACGEFWYVVTESGMQAVANATGLTIRYTSEYEPKE